ncbi:MAG TPA: response regulator [Polyangiaceae bacterium]
MSGEPILIVDDHPQNLKLVSVLLKSEGYEVRTAADSSEVFDILRTFAPAAILMDIQLPGMDGLELTRRLKADPGFRGVWIVALTAYAMKGDEEKAIAAGCDDYISKPLDIDALLALLARRLRNRGASEVPP